jgi:malonyl-CoA O-methyltransferase
MAGASHPPTIDPAAARRWGHAAPARSPWLHEEVGRRMAERLPWIKMQPATWANWEPLRGGMTAHRLVQATYPKSESWIVESASARTATVKEQLAQPWWRRLQAPAVHFGDPPDAGVQMVWSNMGLHMSAQPQVLFGRWHRALAVDGFLMFSCLGPDTLRELRVLHAKLGWPPPSHQFTDMHDWGDMLVHGGFAEPVMDMERITLTWDSPASLLTELRELGANLHPERFPRLRGRAWRARLERELAAGLADGDGRLALTFEVIYGHALKPTPRVRVSGESAIALSDMQTILRGGRELR